MGRFEEIGTALDLLFQKVLNRNFNKADELIQKTEKELNAHTSSTKAHDAGSIAYRGAVVGAENTKQAIDNLKDEVNTIVASAGDGTKDTELILARGNEPTLGDRLDTTDAQLADTTQEIERLDSEIVDKAPISYVDNQIATRVTPQYVEEVVASVSDGTPESFPNLAAIQASYPTGDSHVKLNLEDGYVYKWSGTAWVQGWLYQSRGISDHSVTVESTNFAKRGRNKFDGTFRTGVILTDGTFSNAVGMIAIVPVVSGKTYYFAKDAGDRRRVGFHKTYPSLTSSPQTLDYYTGDVATGVGTLAPNDAKYMLIFASTTNVNMQMQVTEDENPSFFIGYDVDILLKEGSQPVDVLAEGEAIKSILSNRQAVLYGNNPLLRINYNTKSIVIPTSARVLYRGQRIVVANPSTLTWDYNDLIVLYFDPLTHNVGLHRLTAESPLPSNLVTLCVINSVYCEIYGLDIQNCEVDGELFVHPQTKEYVDSRISTISGTARYYFLDDIKGIYNRPDDLASVATGQLIDLVVSSHSLIYDIFDALVAAYPDYVTRTKLGDDTSGLPIYQYRFTAPAITNNSSHVFKKAKLIITSAIHGYEQGSAWCTAQFFKDLCEHWAVKPQLEFMRYNIDFVVVPVANPYGFDHNQRTNMNLVDINRNFNSNWVATGTPGDPNGYYGGPSAASEIETQIMQSFIDAHTDAEYLIDYHNIAGGYPLYYVLDSMGSAIGLSTFRTLTRKWKSDYPQAPQDGTMFGYLNSGPTATLNDYALSKGIKTFTLETPWQMPFASAKYDKVTIETGVDTIGNTLVTICKSLK